MTGRVGHLCDEESVAMSEDAQLAAELRDLLAAGRTIEAIKRLREATGIGLAEAKAAIEGFARGATLPPPSSTPPAPIDAAALEREIVVELEQGRKISAIKIYRAAMGVGLKEAKDAVEAIAERHGFSALAKPGCLGVVLMFLMICLWILTR